MYIRFDFIALKVRVIKGLLAACFCGTHIIVCSDLIAHWLPFLHSKLFLDWQDICWLYVEAFAH